MTDWRHPREVARPALRLVLPAFALLPLTWLLPPVDLSAPLSRAALALSDSGKSGMPFVCVAALALVVSRAGLTARARVLEAGAMLAVLLVFLGAGALVNEHLVKPALESPRPNIVALAEERVLPLSAEAFYRLPTKEERGRFLRGALEAARGNLVLGADVREHWIEETGFSFPSGHSTAAMLVATFFALVGLAAAGPRRRLALFALLPWAVAVCYARPILRVHRPVDVTVGGLQGILLGVFAFLVVHRLAALRRAP